MIGSFGASLFGSTEFARRLTPVVGGKVAAVGDPSSHGGIIITSNQDGSFFVSGALVAVNGALHNCPIHGVISITAVVVKSYHNGKLIVTEGARSICGAIIQPPDRGVSVE
jgi:uncharacterized Zn-binding protein involved in type VI secretion